MKIRSTSYILFFFFVILTSASLVRYSISYAAIPRIMNYQGKLTNSSGLALEGTYYIAFALYDTSESGIPSWAETLTVNIHNGLFDILLGTEHPFDLNFCLPCWMELSISPDGMTGWEILSPREKIAAVSYAFRSIYADTADYVTSGARLRSGELAPLNYTESFSEEQTVPESCRMTTSWYNWDLSDIIPESALAVELSVRFLPGVEELLEGNWGARGIASSNHRISSYRCGNTMDLYTTSLKVPLDGSRIIQIYDDNNTLPLSETGVRFRVIGFWSGE